MATAGNKKDGGNPMDMLGSVLQMAGGGGKKEDMVGNLVKMGLDALLSDKKPAKKPAAKKTTPPPKKTEAKKTEPKKPAKKAEKAPESTQFAPALDLVLRSLEDDPRSHQQLQGLATAVSAFVGGKVAGGGDFLTSTVIPALSNIPGGRKVVEDIQGAVAEAGLAGGGLEQGLAKLADQEECARLAKLLAPRLAPVAGAMRNQGARAAVAGVLGAQIRQGLDSVGIQGVTLKNWDSKLGPMIGMAARGLPSPVPLMKAAQTHAQALLTEAGERLEAWERLDMIDLTAEVEAVLRNSLQRLGSVERYMVLQKGRPVDCVAQVACRAMQKEPPLRAPVVGAYAMWRGWALAPTGPKSPLKVARALVSPPSPCQALFPCEVALEESSTHSALDVDEWSHQEL